MYIEWVGRRRSLVASLTKEKRPAGERCGNHAPHSCSRHRTLGTLIAPCTSAPFGPTYLFNPAISLRFNYYIGYSTHTNDDDRISRAGLSVSIVNVIFCALYPIFHNNNKMSGRMQHPVQSQQQRAGPSSSSSSGMVKVNVKGGPASDTGSVNMKAASAPSVNDFKTKTVLKEAVDAVVSSFAKHSHGYGRGESFVYCTKSLLPASRSA